MDYENENGRYDDEQRYERDRSASPRPMRDVRDRDRSMSPNGRAADRAPPPPAARGAQDDKDDDGSQNPGSNLFVTGIHPRLTETDVSRLFSKYGEVDKCAIMLDPHTKESRGFGFVKMMTAEEADAAKEGLQGEVIEGRTLSIEKARRARPRTPTPGKYFGPPKREFRGPPPRGGRYERYDDRRSAPYGGRRDEGGYRSGGGGGRYDSYSQDRRDRREYRDDYGSRGIDRYASSGREDRYERGGDDRRGGGGGGRYQDRDDRRGGNYSGGGGFDAAASRDTREPYSAGGAGGGGAGGGSGGRSYDNAPAGDRYGGDR